MFPQISKKIQQSVFGAWGGSGSDDETYDGGWLDEVIVVADGGGGNSGGSDYDWGWDDNQNDYGDNYGDDYGGGGGGDYGDDANTDPVTLTNAGDMDSQIGNMCTMEAIRFVSSFVGSSETLNSVTTWIAQNISPTAVVNGMTPAQLVTTMEHFFDSVTEVTTVQAIVSAIDDGNMVLSTFINGADAHAVVITGYDTDTGQFQYADPQTGDEGLWADESDFSTSWEVSGDGTKSSGSTGGGNNGGGGPDPGEYDYDYGY